MISLDGKWDRRDERKMCGNCGQVVSRMGNGAEIFVDYWRLFRYKFRSLYEFVFSEPSVWKCGGPLDEIKADQPLSCATTVRWLIQGFEHHISLQNRS